MVYRPLSIYRVARNSRRIFREFLTVNAATWLSDHSVYRRRRVQRLIENITFDWRKLGLHDTEWKGIIQQTNELYTLRLILLWNTQTISSSPFYSTVLNAHEYRAANVRPSYSRYVCVDKGKIYKSAFYRKTENACLFAIQYRRNWYLPFNPCTRQVDNTRSFWFRNGYSEMRRWNVAVYSSRLVTASGCRVLAEFPSPCLPLSPGLLGVGIYPHM